MYIKRQLSDTNRKGKTENKLFISNTSKKTTKKKIVQNILSKKSKKKEYEQKIRQIPEG
jgi:hypothetical protein